MFDGIHFMAILLAGVLIGALANGSKLGLGAYGLRHNAGALTLGLGALMTLFGWLIGGWLLGASIATPAAVCVGTLGTVGVPWLVARMRADMRLNATQG